MNASIRLGLSIAALSIVAAAALAEDKPGASSGMSPNTSPSITNATATNAPATPPAAMARAKSTEPAKQTQNTHQHMVVDLNKASKEELMKLPGISKTTADKIIAARPFKSKDQLVSKNLVSKTEYQKISSHLTVKQNS